MHRSILTTALACALLAGSAVAQESPDEEMVRLREYVARSARPACEYVADLFVDHDVVIIGEIHEVADNEEFIADLLVDLARRTAVRRYATEFVPRRLSAEANALVQAPQWDEAAAIDLMRRGPNPLWGYREYLAILEAIWRSNADRPPGAAPMLIVGLDSDWKQLALLEEPDQAKNFRTRLERERCMVEGLETAIQEPGAKVLAHVGYAHSITKHGERFATVLKRRYGERIFQVALHHNFPGPGETSPFTGLLEEVLAGQRGPAGVTVKGSPLADLRRDDCMYFTMLGSGRSLDEAAEGYLYLAPVRDLRPVSWIDGFITDETFEQARAIALKMKRLDAQQPCPDAAALNAAMKQHFESRR